MDPLKGQVGGVESPLAVVLHGLGVRQLLSEACAAGPRGQEGRGLESHHRPGKKAQRACVHLEPLEHVGGVEEPHHGNPVGERRKVGCVNVSNSRV